VSSRSEGIAKNLWPGMHYIYKACVALQHKLFDIADTHELHDASLLLLFGTLPCFTENIQYFKSFKFPVKECYQSFKFVMQRSILIPCELLSQCDLE